MTGLKGLYNIQLKGHNEEWYFLEVNTRMAGGIHKAISCGVNLPYLAYADAIGKDISDSKKANSIIVAINKLVSKFISKGKFERDISRQIESDIADINSIEEEMMVTIYNQTLDIVSQIELVRRAINEEYMKVVG